MTQNQEVIEKIKKLLALSTSSNEHEAALAMAQANKLLTKHNLSMNDIGKEKSNVTTQIISTTGKTILWKTLLGQAIAKYNYCELMVSQGRSGVSTLLFGREVNIIASKLMMEYLFVTAEKFAKNYDGNLRNSYKLGFTQRIKERLEELRQVVDNETTDLVVSTASEIKNFWKQNNYQSKERAVQTRTNPVGHVMGYRDADGVSLHNQRS